jgi:branched-chain amino acid transport system substrate-binding protein
MTPRTKLALLLAAISVAIAVVSAASGRTAADPGIGDTSILVGGTAPLSGEASSAAAVSKGAQAYFDYVNAQGGVNGRKIEYKVVDDGYEPARTVQAVRELVQQDGVFAVFNTLGTSNNLAIREFLNEQSVPHLFALTGASTFGAEPTRYPWTIGFIPTYTAEGTILGREAARARPRGRYAVLYQDDDYGKELVAGLRRGLGARSSQIVATVPYDPTAADVQSQVAQLRAARADTFFVFAFGKFAVQAILYANKLGWRPQIYVNAVASSANLMTLASLTAGRRATLGATSVVFVKDPSDPKVVRDAGYRLYLQIMRRYAPGSNVKDGYYMAGMASAATLVDVLRRAGRDLTRDALMRAATSLNMRNPFLVNGLVLRTSATDRFPMEQVQLQRWQGDHWVAYGSLLTAKSV